MKNFFCAFIIIFILTACQATQDALTLKKKPSADEFLVEKKSPLVLPPSYGDLPIPNEERVNDKIDNNKNAKVTIGNDELEIGVPIKNSKPTSLEQSVLEKIK